MKDACRMKDLTGPGLFDDAETPSEMIYDFINVMDAIIRSPHHDVVHASISLGANPAQKCGTDLEDESADHLDPDCHSTLAFSLRNSTRNCPEFIVTGCDPIEGEDIIAIASTVWNSLVDDIQAGEPVQLEDRLLYFMPVTASGVTNLKDGIHPLRAAELRLAGEGVATPSWIQIVHSDLNHRFPWEAGYSAPITQPLAGIRPDHATGSTKLH